MHEERTVCKKCVELLEERQDIKMKYETICNVVEECYNLSISQNSPHLFISPDYNFKKGGKKI